MADIIGAVEQSNQYYPFGMLFAESTNPQLQDYKYNGKELDRMHRLNLYDSNARFYNPVIPSTPTQDPLAEKYYNLSPYSWVANNPMRYVDPTGMWYDIYQVEVDQNGVPQEVKVIEDKNVDRVEFVDSEGNVLDQTQDYKAGTFEYSTNNNGDIVFSTTNADAATNLFSIAVGDGTKEGSPTYVEWSLSTLAKDGSLNINAVGTSKSGRSEGAGGRYINRMEGEGYFLKEHTHNHPGNIGYPSGLNELKLGGDLKFAKNRTDYNLSKGKAAPIFNLYINKQKIPYTHQSVPSSFSVYPY